MSGLICLVALCLLAGCGGGKSTTNSGFLSTYAGLEQDPIRNEARSYVNPNKGFEAYDKFHVQPVIVHFAPQSEGTTIDPAELRELTTMFDEAMAEALSENYKVVDKPGEGVLRLRIAITDIQEGNTVLNAAPQTKLLGLGLGGASMEAEAFDTKTGERIAAYMETAKGSQFAVEGLGPLDNARQVIKIWVEDFVERVDEAHGN